MFRIFAIMPQLDSQTYFSQFVYLIISFVAVYILILNFILPRVVAVQKMRQKLNSIATAVAKLDRAASDELGHPVEVLRSAKWQSAAKLAEKWPSSARSLQIQRALTFKKSLCTYVLRRAQ